jgi:hypothetical protein
MFGQVLSLCEKNYNEAKNYCCHGSNNLALMFCNSSGCQECLKKDFRERPDDYDCDKKMNCYVLRYGSAYISEIYHYLNASKILEPYKGQGINVLSLGCGFCPDYFAISQYIDDRELGINFDYYGIEKSIHWNTTRLKFSNIKEYWQLDLTNPFSLKNCQIIMMNKVFSTIYKHKLHDVFFKNLVTAINTMDENSVFIFNDINSIHMGRDIFDETIAPFFDASKIRRFYTDSPEYKGNDWIHIQDNSIICPMTDIVEIDVLREVRKFVFFEYRK